MVEKRERNGRTASDRAPLAWKVSLVPRMPTRPRLPRAERSCAECGAPLRSKRDPRTLLCRVCNAKHSGQTAWKWKNGIRAEAPASALVADAE